MSVVYITYKNRCCQQNCVIGMLFSSLLVYMSIPLPFDTAYEKIPTR